MSPTLTHSIGKSAANLRAADLPDDHLLRGYTDVGDQESFAGLVHRYSPLVWSVCRRTVADSHAAEDAFQITFLTLARKARSLDATRPLANWLYTVAHRAASRLNRQISRADKSLPDVTNPSAPDPLEAVSGREVARTLDEELARLPDRERVVVLLCCLEGLSRDEAASRLGWTLGAVKKRLERGRDRLRHALSRRGVTLGLALAGATLATRPTPAVISRVIARLTAEPVGPATAFLSAAGLLRGRVVALLVATASVATAALLTTPASPAPATEPPQPKSPTAAVPRLDRFGDVLPDGAALRLGTVRFRHGFLTSAIRYAPDGKSLFVAAAGQDPVGVYDADTGKFLTGLGKSGWNAHSLAVSPDGKRLVVSNDAKGAPVIDTATGEELFRVGGWCQAVAWSGDGKRVATCGEKKLSVFDARTGRLLFGVVNTIGSPTDLAFTPDGRLVTVNTEGNAHVYDTDGKSEGTFPVGDKAVAVSVAPNGKRAVVRRDGQPTDVYDLATGKVVHTLPDVTSHWRTVRYTPDGSRLALGDKSGRVNVYDTGTWRTVLTIGVGTITPSALDFSPDGTKLAVAGTWQSGPRVWDVTTGREVTTSAGLHHASVSVVQHDPKTGVLYSWARDKKMVRWDLTTGGGTDRVTGPDDGLFYSAGAISPDGRRVAAVTLKGPTIKLWDAETGRLIRDVFRLPAADSGRFWMYSLTFSPDGAKLAAGDTDGRARIWDVESGKLLAEWKGGKLGRPAAALRFTPSGSEVLIGVSRGKTPFGAVVRWDFARDRTVKWVNVTQDVTNFAVSPDATRAVVCSDYESPPALWDLAAGKQLARLAAHSRGSYAAAFSPDGHCFATGGEDKDHTVRVWDATSGQELATFRGPPAAAMSLTFSPDGRRLIGGYGDSTIMVWDLTGRSGGLGPIPKSLDEAWRRLGAAGGRVSSRRRSPSPTIRQGV